MYCKQCGAQIPNDVHHCPHCGVLIETTNPQSTYQQTTPQQPSNNITNNEPKTAFGVILALALGLIGLIIGLVMYPEGSVARSTFLKAWLITYLVATVISVIIGIIFSLFLYPAILEIAQEEYETTVAVIRNLI